MAGFHSFTSTFIGSEHKPMQTTSGFMNILTGPPSPPLNGLTAFLPCSRMIDSKYTCAIRVPPSELWTSRLMERRPFVCSNKSQRIGFHDGERRATLRPLDDERPRADDSTDSGRNTLAALLGILLTKSRTGGHTPVFVRLARSLHAHL